jgi:hypothetical protein
MLAGSVAAGRPMRAARLMIVRVGVCAAVLLAFGSLQACSKSTHPAKATASTTTPTSAARVAVADFPRALHLDPERVLTAFLDLQYGDSSAAHRYMGFANSRSGQTVQLEVDALASTSAQASRDCAAIAGPAAFFMKGVTYALVIAGEVSVASAASPGSVSFQPATFKPVSCPKPEVPLVDPIRANEPRTSGSAVDRFVGFLSKYYRAIGASDADSWYAGYAYAGTGTKIEVDVHDPTAAVGTTRCDTVRPLAAWLLGPFAKQFTVQVRGTSGAGSTSWPAANCA